MLLTLPMRLPHRVRRGVVVAAAVVAVAGLTSGCSLFGGGHDPNSLGSVSVFDITPGECFTAPKQVKAELSSLDRVPCERPHSEESYATLTYSAPQLTTTAPAAASASNAGAPYPGGDALTKFANGACAAKFTDYVGVSYLDSKFFFTYLLPSARSWEQDDDHTVICFVTQTGGMRTGSAKNLKQ